MSTKKLRQASSTNLSKKLPRTSFCWWTKFNLQTFCSLIVMFLIILLLLPLFFLPYLTFTSSSIPLKKILRHSHSNLFLHIHFHFACALCAVQTSFIVPVLQAYLARHSHKMILKRSLSYVNMKVHQHFLSLYLIKFSCSSVNNFSVCDCGYKKMTINEESNS